MIVSFPQSKYRHGSDCHRIDTSQFPVITSGQTCSFRRHVVDSDWPMFRRFYVQKVLCSENICSKGSMFRRFYIQKVLCSEGSMFRRFYIQKVQCSEGLMFRKKLFKRSYIQKALCSEGPIFRYIQKVLYSENSLFHVEKTPSFSPSTICPNRYWDFNQHSEQPQTRSDHRRIVPAIQKYDTTVDLVISACSNFHEFLILGLFTLVVLL